MKTNNGVIGFDPASGRLLTVGEQALEVGKKVGLVTSVTFNHATPAGFIAHNGNRNDYHGLATEMIDSGIDVIIGAGHPDGGRGRRRRLARDPAPPCAGLPAAGRQREPHSRSVKTRATVRPMASATTTNSAVIAFWIAASVSPSMTPAIDR